MTPEPNAQTAAAPVKPRRRGRRAWFVRPPEAQDNHPIPYLGWEVRHAMTRSNAIVYSAICAQPRTELPLTKDGTPRGSIVREGSIRKVARSTAPFMPRATAAEPAVLDTMHPRTVAHNIDALIEKGFVDAWEIASRAQHSPYGASYRIVPWAEVLQRWAADEKIATVAGTRRFYVWGKGRWHLSPADVVAWKVDHAKAAADPAAAARGAAIEEPAAAGKPESRISVKPESLPPARPSATELLMEDVAVVHRCILDHGVPAEPWHAEALLALAREVAPELPAAVVGMLITQMTADFHTKQRTRTANKYDPVRLTIGWYQVGMRAQVNLWLRERDAAQRATGTAF